MAEAYKRGLMSPRQKELYQEAMRRGLISDPVSVKGTAQSFGSGFAKGAAGMADMAPMSTQSLGGGIDMASRVLNFAGAKLGLQSDAQGDANVAAQVKARQGSPLETYNEQLGRSGLLHQAQNSAERFADTAGQFVPNAFVPGGAGKTLLGKVAARIIAPAVGATVAPAAVKALGGNETAQNIAGVGGAVLAGALPNALKRVPLSITGLTPVEARAVQKFAARTKPDVNAMTAQTGAMRGAGINPTLIDATSDGGRGIIRAAASRQTPGRDAVQGFADQRALDLPDRMGAQARKIISSDPRSPPKIQADLAATRAKAANAAYGAVRDDPVHLGPDATDALNTEAGQKALQAVISKEPNPVARADLLKLKQDGPAGSAPLDPHTATALADIRTYGAKQTGGLFRAIQERGGMRVTDELGNRLPGPDLTLDDRMAPGVVNNKSGMSPEYMAQSLSDDGWFGYNGAEPSRAFEAAFNDHVAGRPYYHPDSYQPGFAENAQNLQEELTRAGVSSSDRASVAAPKLAAYRQSANGSPDAIPPPNAPPITTVGTLHDISEELNNRAEAAAAAAGGANDARKLGNLAHAIRSPAAEQSPGYAAANAQYAGDSRNMEAATTGEGFLKTNPDEFTPAINAMNPDQLALARATARRSVEQAVGNNTSAAPGVARRIANASSQRERNAALLGPDADRLQNNMGLEALAVKNAGQAAPRTGSQTNLNAQDTGALGGARDVAAGVAGLAHGNPLPAMWGGLKFWLAKQGFNDNEAQALSSLATDPSRLADVHSYIAAKAGPQTAGAFLQAIGSRTQNAFQPKNLVPAFIPGAISAGNALQSSPQ